ncbi:MAG: DNA-processing protein DprA [Deltaproteobacteria bacterium]|nr:DNA-processing protein DprA [Deltaproteobacteria bacterium]
MKQREYYILKLLNVPGLGNAKVKRILEHCHRKGISIKGYIEDIIRGDRKTPLLTPSQINSLVDGDSRFENQWKAIKEQDIRILTIGDSNYPARMVSALNNKAPMLLFAKGDIGLLTKPCLGFCGSRQASEKGLETAWDCADQMARKGVNIISGYASGVDMTAHKAALEAGGTTTLVLAEGILNFRIKKGLKDVFDESKVLILSEFLPGTSWSVRNAMQRNSTICSLSQVMILIEAEKKVVALALGGHHLKWDGLYLPLCMKGCLLPLLGTGYCFHRAHTDSKRASKQCGPI